MAKFNLVLLSRYTPTLLENSMNRAEFEQRRDFQEITGKDITKKEIAIRNRRFPAKAFSSIQIGRDRTTYSMKDAKMMAGDTVAVIVRPLNEFGWSRRTLYKDSKYFYLSGEDVDFNNWIDYRIRLRRIREGFQIGTYNRTEKARMLAGIIKAHKGSVNTSRHLVVMKTNSGRLAPI